MNQHKHYSKLVEYTRQATSDTRALIEELSEAFYVIDSGGVCRCCRAGELEAVVRAGVGTDPVIILGAGGGQVITKLG